MERDYADRGVQFYYIYKSLAHPENNGYVAPFNLKERLLHIAEAKRTLDTRFQWLCDTMDNDLKHTLGDRPNSEFLIDPSGRILVARPWSDPAQLRQDLEKHVGLVVKPTRVLRLESLRSSASSASGDGCGEAAYDAGFDDSSKD